MREGTKNINWQDIIQRWEALPHGQRGGYVKSLEAYGISRDQFYARKRRLRGRSKKVDRSSDAYKLQIAKVVMEMKERGKLRSDDPRELATWRCLKRLEEKGIMKPGAISEAHCNYLLREQLGYREITPRVRWECEYALQEVQTDGSTSKFFRPWKYDKNGDVLLKAAGRALNYRKGEEKEKVILWQFQDKYSRLRTVRGFPAKAESAEIMLSHMKFWLNRERDEHPMYHLPWEIASDSGSLFKTDAYASVIRSLELEQRNSTPYEKTGIGSVENRWKVIWQHELMWSEDYPTIWLSEYNMLLHEAMIAEQEEAHPVLHTPKGTVYQQSLLRQEPRPRVLEYDLFSLVHDTYERKVTPEVAVSVNNEKLRVPQYVEGVDTVGKKVLLYRNWEGEWRGKLANGEAEGTFTLESYTYRVKGDFSGSFQHTTTQRLKDEIAGKKSRYDAIISGKTRIEETGEIVDPETGEIIEPEDPDSPQKLQPKAEAASPKSPFLEEEAPAEAKTFSNIFEAKTWIGRQLAQYELTYADVASHFDSKLIDYYALDREKIAQAVIKLKEILTKTA